MARIAGVDLPRDKKVFAALPYIYGIGPSRAKEILESTGVDRDTRVRDLTEEEVARIRDYIDNNYKVEGDLRMEEQLNIKRLIDLGTYRGCLLYTSFIFGGIVSGLPRDLGTLYVLLKSGQTKWYNVIGLIAITLGTLIAVIWVTEGERRVPVQYSKRVVGRKMMGGYSTHIPIRINQAGVIPVIFASSLLALPATLATLSLIHI